MSRFRSDRLIVAFPDVLLSPVFWAPPDRMLSEENLANPDEGLDAAMDYVLPRDANPEILRLAERRILAHIGWLLDDAPARYPSWSKDELQRAVRRLLELRTAAKRARPRSH